MKISDTIAKLQVLLAEHGDIDCCSSGTFGLISTVPSIYTIDEYDYPGDVIEWGYGCKIIIF